MIYRHAMRGGTFCPTASSEQMLKSSRIAKADEVIDPQRGQDGGVKRQIRHVRRHLFSNSHQIDTCSASDVDVSNSAAKTTQRIRRISDFAFYLCSDQRSRGDESAFVSVLYYLVEQIALAQFSRRRHGRTANFNATVWVY